MQLDIDTSGVAILANQMGANLKQMRAAELRALNKTMTWLAGRAARAMSQEAKIAVKIAKQRIRAYKASRSTLTGRAWVGLNPLPAHRAGQVKQQRKGARAGRHLFAGAFAVDTGKGKVAIFQRTGEAKRTMRRGAYRGSKIKREPIERVDIELDTPAVRSAIAAVFNGAQQRFWQVLQQELNFSTRVRRA